MYVSMKHMLNRASSGKYAVMAINCFNIETVKAVIEAAEEMNSPIIIDLLQEHLLGHIDCQFLMPALIRMADNSSVEVAINLDHGQEVEHLKKCIDEGFSSVMADASMYSLDENIAIVKEIVQLAHQKGVAVEAELGCMGAVAGEQWTNEQMFTNPDEAITFVKETKVDCLAISYGSSHGDYPAGYVPAFRFDIVEKIKTATNIPLVLHGGSGAGKEAIQKSIKLGVSKINVGSDFMKAQLEYIKQNSKCCCDYVSLIHETIASGKEVVKSYIEIAGSQNKSLIKKEERYVIKYD